MRLLSKSDIEKGKALDRAREVAEGLKVSGSVDSLRRLKAEEEAQFEKWRDGSIAEIHRQIRKAEEERDTVLGEVRTLRDELARENVLSREERKNLESLKTRLDGKEVELTKKEEVLGLLEIDIAVALKNASDSEIRALSHEETAKNLHGEVSRKTAEADHALSRAQILYENTVKAKDEAEMALFGREYAIIEHEKQLKLTEQENERVARELAAEKIQVADQRATLERSIERLRKNRLA